MKPITTSGVAGSVRARLLTLAKERKEDYNLVLTRYALERFLYRLSHSEHRSELILKGAMLFQVWSQTPHRATRDLDLLASGDVSIEGIKAKISAICAVEAPEDGLVFDLSDLGIGDIRDDNRYGGVRGKFIAQLGSAKIALQLDFGIGDAITPAAAETEYPTLLKMAAPHVLAYPRETVVAEKLEAIVDLGMANSRMKDYFDLWFIATSFTDDPEIMALAVRNTFERRQQAIPDDVPPGLLSEFANDPAKEVQWTAFIRTTIGALVPLEDAVSLIRGFAMPLFRAARLSQ